MRKSPNPRHGRQHDHGCHIANLPDLFHISPPEPARARVRVAVPSGRGPIRNPKARPTEWDKLYGIAAVVNRLLPADAQLTAEQDGRIGADTRERLNETLARVLQDVRWVESVVAAARQ